MMCYCCCCYDSFLVEEADNPEDLLFYYDYYFFRALLFVTLYPTLLLYVEELAFCHNPHYNRPHQGLVLVVFVAAAFAFLPWEEAHHTLSHRVVIEARHRQGLFPVAFVAASAFLTREEAHPTLSHHVVGEVALASSPQAPAAAPSSHP